MRPSPASPRAAAIAVAALAASLLASGCAATKKGLIVWPRPPEVPRIQYVRSFRAPDDMTKSVGRTIAQALVPRDPRSVITEPTSIALSRNEEFLYVVSAVKQRVVRVDLVRGAMDIVAEPTGAKPVNPYGVAVDGDDNLYVSDRSENVIFVFSSGGAFLRKFGRGKLEVPGGLAIDRKRQLLYVIAGATNDTDHRVEVFSLQGEHLRTIGKRGHAPGEFNFPSAIAVAPDGNLYVSDMLNFRVEVFSPEGELQTLFGELGAGEPGTFEKGKGIGFDTFGNIYVVDSMHGVQIFNPKFHSLLAFAEGFVKTGGSIAVSSKNDIYVSDYVLAGIHQFKLINTTQADSYAPADDTSPPAKGAPRAAPTTPSTEGSKEAPPAAPLSDGSK